MWLMAIDKRVSSGSNEEQVVDHQALSETGCGKAHVLEKWDVSTWSVSSHKVVCN